MIQSSGVINTKAITEAVWEFLKGYGDTGRRRVPWKRRSLCTGQEQEYLGGDAKENTVLEDPGIKIY